jgi:hypothetical protein
METGIRPSVASSETVPLTIYVSILTGEYVRDAPLASKRPTGATVSETGKLAAIPSTKLPPATNVRLLHETI